MTLGASRSVTCCLGSSPTGGRPRFVSVPDASRMTLPPIAIWARPATSRVSSGASSGSIQLGLIDLLFALICFSHRDDVPALTARRPNHGDHPALQKTVSHPPNLAIVLAIVENVDCR